MQNWVRWTLGIIAIAVATSAVAALSLFAALHSGSSDFAYTFGTRTGVATAPTTGYGLATDIAGVPAGDLDQRLSDMKATGATWVRYDLSWKLVQPNNATSYDWSTYDRVTKAATDHGFKVLMIIDFAPVWAQKSGCNGSDICVPANPITYAKFAAAAVGRYKSYGVRDWEIWNEPNVGYRFNGKADAAFYTRMLKDSYSAIKRVDSSAVVITGGTSPASTDGNNYSPADFIKALYNHGAGGWFDAVGAHPYTYPISPAKSTSTDAWGQMSATHKLMADHGDGNKQIWVTEYGAPTDGPDPAKRVSEAEQAQMATDSIGIFHGYSWGGPFFWYNYMNSGSDTSSSENFYGLVAADGSQKPSYAAFVTAVATTK